jgi:hypothetical protein
MNRSPEGPEKEAPTAVLTGVACGRLPQDLKIRSVTREVRHPKELVADTPVDKPRCEEIHVRALGVARIESYPNQPLLDLSPHATDVNEQLRSTGARIVDPDVPLGFLDIPDSAIWREGERNRLFESADHALKDDRRALLRGCYRRGAVAHREGR